MRRIAICLVVVALALGMTYSLRGGIAAPSQIRHNDASVANEHKSDHEDNGKGNDDNGHGNGAGHRSDRADEVAQDDQADQADQEDQDGQGADAPDDASSAESGHGPSADADEDADETSDEAVADAATPKAVSKVLICHKTGSAKNPFTLIDISVNALPAHEAHGDFIAPDGVESKADCAAAAEGTPGASPAAEPAD